MPYDAAPGARSRLGGRALGSQVVADDLDVPEWIGGRAGEMAELARRGLAAPAAGDSLVHWDLRADNLLITDDGRVVFVDWARAPAWAAGKSRVSHADFPAAGRPHRVSSAPGQLVTSTSVPPRVVAPSE